MSTQINSWSAQLQKGNYLLGTIIPQKNYALHPGRQKATSKAILSKKKNCWVNPALRYPYRILFNLPRSGMEIREIPMNSSQHLIEPPKHRGKKSYPCIQHPRTNLSKVKSCDDSCDVFCLYSKWLFQSDDSTSLHKKWVKMIVSPNIHLKTGSFLGFVRVSHVFFQNPSTSCRLALGSLALLVHLRLRPHRCVWRSRAPSCQTTSWSWSWLPSGMGSYHVIWKILGFFSYLALLISQPR